MGASMHNKASQLLRAEIESASFEGANIFFVFSYPRSDMGKGTLVAHGMRMLTDANAIKFDGLINTNQSGRHTVRGNDDLGTYERYNPDRRFGDKNYILGGSFYQEFIEAYGEYENLTIRPHVAQFFWIKLNRMWKELGCPRNLFIEIGGLITDFEVDPFVTPVVRELKELLKDRCKIILLSEVGYSDNVVKTKSVQDAVSTFLERRVKPDIIVVREPSEMGKVDLQQRTDIERTVANKFVENLGISFEVILSVPYFKPEEIGNYGKFLDKYLKPILENNKLIPNGNIFMGTINPHKISDWRTFMAGKFNVVAPQDIDLHLKVIEGTVSTEENSMAKAKAWCRASGMVTIADDTGFYINELGGQPGVAVKRWAGALPEDTTDEELFSYMRDQVEHLTDTSCYFKTIITIAWPNGETKQIVHITEGFIDKELLKKGYTSGFPLGLVFKKIGRNKVWADMSDEEKRVSDKDLADRVLTYLGNLTGK